MFFLTLLPAENPCPSNQPQGTGAAAGTFQTEPEAETRPSREVPGP